MGANKEYLGDPLPPGLQAAARYALNSTLRVRVGAYVNGKGSDWIGAWNTKKSHPALAKIGYPEWSTRHAELALALSAGRGKLEGRDVFVARLLLNGDWAMARPCACCAKMLAGERVRSVTWTVGPGRWDSLTL